MQKGDDPYEILGVSYDASEDEIKKTYRKAALKWHPDRHTDEKDKEHANDVFAKISAAYDVLTDPVKRYDWKQANEDKMKGNASSSASSKPSAPAPAPASRPPPTNSPRPKPPTRRNSAPVPRQQQQQQQQQTQQSSQAPPPSKPNADTSYSGAGAGTKERVGTGLGPGKKRAKPPKRRGSTGVLNSKKAAARERAAQSKPDSSYSMKPGERTFASPTRTMSSPKPGSAGTKKKKRVSQMPGPPLESNSTHSAPAVKARAKSPGTKRGSRSKSPATKKATKRSSDPLNNSNHSRGNLRRAAKGTSKQEQAPTRSPRPGSKRVSAPASIASRKPKQGDIHDPFKVFDQIMRQEFGPRYKEADFYQKAKSSGMFGGGAKTITAKPLPSGDTNPDRVVSMSTSTKTFPQKDGQVEIKTVTKIARADGSVEKVVQASVADKETAKQLPKNTDMTMTRAKK